MKLVSVLMSTYNEPIEYVEKAVQSILLQSYLNIEFIIIVDNPNNSSVVEYLKMCEEKDARVRVWINETNRGLVSSLNRGLQYCNGDYIARMDADDISETYRLERQISYMIEKDYDLVGSGIKTFADEKIIGSFYPPEEDGKCRRGLKYYTCVQHPAWICRREVYEKLEGYRDIKACEDYDFLIRAVLNGFRIGNCQEALLKYRRNMKSISNTNKYSQKAIANFLARKFRQGKIVEMKEYEKYIQSEKYNKAVLREQELERNKGEFKKTRNLLKKGWLLIKVLGNFEYVSQRLIIASTSKKEYRI